jgi:hypothetical protein
VPPEALSGGLPVDAVVTLAGSDGLSERMTVPRIDLVSSGPDRSPEIALLWLPRPVPGTTTPVLRPTLPNSTITAGRTLWDILDRDGVAPTQFAHDDEPEALAPWAAAADVALADGDVDAAEQASVHAVFVTFADVAWGCHTIRACDEDGKGDGSHDSDMPYPFSPDHPFDVRRDRPDDYPSSSQTSA